MTPTDARDDLVERDAKPTPDKRDEALRLALPLLEMHQCAVIERNNCLGEIDEIDTAIAAIRDALGEDGG